MEMSFVPSDGLGLYLMRRCVFQDGLICFHSAMGPDHALGCDWVRYVVDN